VRDPQHAVVTLLALVNGQLIQLGVPVAASAGGVVVSGEPACKSRDGIKTRSDVWYVGCRPAKRKWYVKGIGASTEAVGAR